MPSWDSGTGRGPARRGRVRQRALRLAAAIALVAGIAFVSYPFVSNAILQVVQGRMAQENIVLTEEAGGGRLDQERAAAVAYNERMGDSLAYLVDPFNPRNPEIAFLDEYDSILDIGGNGVMGSVEIPEIRVFVPIYHGTSDEVLAKGSGHLYRTSLPVGGSSSHCVIAGHTGLPSVRIFDDLEKLGEGSIVVLNVLGERLGYKVYSIEVVEPDETSSLAIQEGRDLLTLLTCTPYGVNSHRLLVHAERCDLDDEEVKEALAKADEPSALRWIVPAIAVPAVAILVSFLALRRRGISSDGKHAAAVSGKRGRR